jgi:PmbA protein
LNERGPAELEGIAARALEVALDAGAGEAEAYSEDSTGIEIRVYEGEVESLSESAQRGAGVRAWIDGRMGYAYGTDLSPDGVRAIAAGAVEAARIADPDEFAGPPALGRITAQTISGLHDPALAEWGSERKVSLAQKAERACRAADHRVAAIEETVYADEEARVAIASSAGLHGAYATTSCYAFLRAIAADEGRDRQTGLGFGVARAPGGLDPEAIGVEGAERAASLLGATKPASRSCPAVLDETVAASFVGFIGGVLCADAVQRGRSPFADRLGDEIASAALTLSDDGTDPEGPASAPFDAEGTPRTRIPLIEAGKLRTYLHDAYTARREGERQRSTGNASRAGYRSPPSVSTSNLVIAPGDGALEELLREADGGVYITDVAGLHSGVNPVSGIFSVGASGREISGGELGAPLTEFTIASDLPSMLGAVRAAARETRWVPFGGSVKSTALLIGEMAVGGR